MISATIITSGKDDKLTTAQRDMQRYPHSALTKSNETYKAAVYQNIHF